jgi:hypothetical protein
LKFSAVFIGLALAIASTGISAQHIGAAAALSAQDFILEETKVTNAQASEAKAALLSYLSSEEHHIFQDGAEMYAEQKRSSLISHFDDYLIQYVGSYDSTNETPESIDKNPDRAVLINGLCKEFPVQRAQLRKHMLEVNDGGSCIFRSLYNLPKHKIVMFLVNHD